MFFRHEYYLCIGRIHMTWYTPKVSEVAVGLEINSYACAEV